MNAGPPPDDLAARKRALRSQARRAGSALGKAERVRRSRELEAHLIGLPELASAGAVALYAPLPDEVQLDLLPVQLRERGCRLAYPRVDPDGLALHWVATPLASRVGPRVLREPDAVSPLAEPEALAAILIPGLLFDRQGRRLGRGGGHYDRLLARIPPSVLSIGVCLAEQLVDALPAEAHDVPLRRIVTDREVLRIS